MRSAEIERLSRSTSSSIESRPNSRRRPILVSPAPYFEIIHDNLGKANSFTRRNGGRRSLPMYDVRSTMYDCQIRAPKARAMRSDSEGAVAAARGGCLCTMYDFRCTIWIIARQRRGNFAERARAGCRATVRGRSYKGTGGGAWQRLCTIFPYNAREFGNRTSNIVHRQTHFLMRLLGGGV